MAEISKYPQEGNETLIPSDLSPTGIAYAKFKTSQSVDLDFKFKLHDVEGHCKDCGIHIHAGMSCDNHVNVLGHHWTPADADDPWNEVTYTSKRKGKAKGRYFNISNGYNYDENIGHAVVVHGIDGVRVGCGVLEEIECSSLPMRRTIMTERALFDGFGDKPVLTACIGKYPAYEGSLEGVVPSGTVKAAFGKRGNFVFAHSLKNLEAKCKSCGLHIHRGTSCNSHDDVGSHLWEPLEANDPWNNVTYDSNKYGEAVGDKKGMGNGYDFAGNIGRAVVVHAFNGSRIGCGILQNTSADAWCDAE